MNIVRISLHLELAGKWNDDHTVVTYGWLPRTDMARRLIPLTISTEVEFKNKFYWCRGVFRNYQQ